MKAIRKFIGLFCCLVVVVVLFMQYDLAVDSGYALSKRGIRLGSMIVVGVSVAFSSLIFQTLSNNRILTPSIMGYEAVFILFQTVLVFIYGDQTFQVISQQTNFFYAVFFMLLFSIGMYLLMFGKQQKGMFHLLLMGMVMGTLFQTLSQFMHVLIDPNAFSIVQNFMFVSFAKMNTKLLLIASVTLSVTVLYTMSQVHYLDVIALGREHAVNLGLNYTSLVRRFMLIIAMLVSVSTALVGPITFLGILVTNLTYELFKTRQHRWMLWICSTVACLFLIAGQFLVEHIFSFSTTVSIIINFIGAVYFMYLIWMSRKKIA